MENFNFKLNNKIKIKLDDITYISTIQDYSDNFILISQPIVNRRYVELKKDLEVEIEINLNNYAMYILRCYVIENIKEDNKFFIKLSYPHNYNKIQRRRDVRVKILEDIKFYRNLRNSTPSTNECFMIDLSGSGMKVKVKEKLEIGEKLLFRIPIENKFAYLNAVVIRNEKSLDGNLLYGVEFNNIDEKIREKLIRKVFDKQRKELKNGLTK